ncbi:hypothetical protein NF556_06625 [Ornithinimicrobium faecis]|uniref:Lipoprotein n=1 Tax=Ornithinimicrobium faecis TaxID=2934158 RepID=A0ABY4YXY8_9MICO|nr:hypothetical protein [Ornithinimicrobium sp. HY1793]USQ81315.1 hypothetical protein NF556_06625 [Ornithinimicrobium sp. HY1793]
MVGISRVAALGVVALPVLVLAAGCSEPDPSETMIKVCEDTAISQLDLSGAGDTLLRELPVEDGTSFEVTGVSEGTEWVCTWTETQRQGSTSTTITVDRR